MKHNYWSFSQLSTFHFPSLLSLSFYPPLVPFRAREKIIFAVSKKQSIRNSVLFNIGNEKLDETFVQSPYPPTTPSLQQPLPSNNPCPPTPLLFQNILQTGPFSLPFRLPPNFQKTITNEYFVTPSLSPHCLVFDILYFFMKNYQLVHTL